MRRWLFENSLSIAFLVLFLGTVVGQSFAGQHVFNEGQRAHGGAQVAWHEYLTSSQFARAVMENWQSEFLQFFLFILITVWLVQRGSNESKEPAEIGTESDQRQRVKGYAPPNAPRWARVRDWRRRVYENSLLLHDARDLPALVARPVAHRLARLQRRATRPPRRRDRLEQSMRPDRNSGRARSRTGSPSSSPSEAWPSSRSTYGNAAHPNQSLSAHHTTKPAAPASPPTPDTHVLRPCYGGGRGRRLPAQRRRQVGRAPAPIVRPSRRIHKPIGRHLTRPAATQTRTTTRLARDPRASDAFPELGTVDPTPARRCTSTPRDERAAQRSRYAPTSVAIASQTRCGSNDCRRRLRPPLSAELIDLASRR